MNAMRTLRTLALTGMTALMTAGCVERTETIVINADGSVHMRLSWETESFAELHEGDAVPTFEGGWIVTESSRRDDEGREHLRLDAESLFRPDTPLPSTYASPLDPDAELSLSFPTTLTFEARPDGTYVHFRRVYDERPWAFLETARDLRDGQLEKLSQDREFDELTRGEQIGLIQTVVRFELMKYEAFARAAYLKALPDGPQDVWLFLRSRLSDELQSMNYDDLLQHLLAERGDDADEQRSDAWLEDEGRRFEQRIVEVLQSALRERATVGDTNAFIHGFRAQQRLYEITEDLADDKFVVTVQMPGQVVGHNGDDLAANRVTWTFSGAMMRDRELELMVTARMEN